ncbi:DedA family protein [Actinomycetes bacterium M1A6_2h]
MSDYLDFLGSIPPIAIYVVIAALVFGESAALLGMVLPGEPALIAGGTLAATGQVSLASVIVTATVGAVAGDAVGFVVGRTFGPSLRVGKIGGWVGEPRWVRSERAMDRHGALLVLGARWVGILRSIAPPVAGMSGMTAPRFMALNAIGGLAWVSVICTVGFYVGSALTRASIDTMTLVVVAVTVLAAAAHLIAQRVRGRRPESVHA